jgi:hypothetical protein
VVAISFLGTTTTKYLKHLTFPFSIILLYIYCHFTATAFNVRFKPIKAKNKFQELPFKVGDKRVSRISFKKKLPPQKILKDLETSFLRQHSTPAESKSRVKIYYHLSHLFLVIRQISQNESSMLNDVS